MIFRFCFLLHYITVLIIIIVANQGSSSVILNETLLFSSNNQSNVTLRHQERNHRKLSVHAGSCSPRDISISQSKDMSANGIPRYIVQIVNTCTIPTGCDPSRIHLHCGWFASARIINPKTFKRLSYDDCLVNGGRPMRSSHVIRFTYSNSFMYPLAFKSANFC